MILALLVPPLVALGTLALAIVMAQAARRRPLVKSAFNIGQVLIAAGLGLSVSRGLAAPTASLTAEQVAAVTLGVVGVLRRQHPSGGRRPGLDGHALARAHR